MTSSPSSLRPLMAALGMGFGLSLLAATAIAQTVADRIAETYASDIPSPVWLSFAPDGTLFAGHDPNPDGGGNTRLISRIATGGSPATPWWVSANA